MARAGYYHSPAAWALHRGRNEWGGDWCWVGGIQGTCINRESRTNLHLECGVSVYEISSLFLLAHVVSWVPVVHRMCILHWMLYPTVFSVYRLYFPWCLSTAAWLRGALRVWEWLSATTLPHCDPLSLFALCAPLVLPPRSTCYPHTWTRTGQLSLYPLSTWRTKNK